MSQGNVQVDDAYLGGERVGGKAGRGSENKVPFVAAVSLNTEGHPMYLKMAPVSGFTRKAIGEWAKQDLSPDYVVISDGLSCFTGVLDAGCQHHAIIAGARKPKEIPEFRWINTLLGNLKTSLGGSYHAFNFAKYGIRYLSAFVYRFNRRFYLDTLPMHLRVPPLPVNPVLQLGFAKLKNLANQVMLCRKRYRLDELILTHSLLNTSKTCFELLD